CHFRKTVNVSSSQRFENGSYLYQDFVDPANLIDEYNYTTINLGYYNDTEDLRGCVCRLKPCIWICCRFIDWDASNGHCNDGLMEELSDINPSLKVTLSNGSVVERKLIKDFIVFDTWKEDVYTVFENGNILLRGHVNWTYKGYDCIHPNQFSSGNPDLFSVAIHNRSHPKVSQEFSPGAEELIWLSEVFLILTTAVYFYIKKLRNLHGKCFICYMVASFIFFIHEWLEHVEIPLQFCALYGKLYYIINKLIFQIHQKLYKIMFQIAAYSYYFIAMVKLTLLLSLTHQMWMGFTSLNRAESQHSFRAYSIFAWGTAVILTGILFLIDYIWSGKPSNVNWIPGVGWQCCDIKNDMRPAYIRGPFNTLIALNTALFIWTIISIIRAKLSLKQFCDRGDTARNFNSRMQAYTMYIRLFVAMDIQWSVRIISFFCNWQHIFLICKYCDYCMGIIIFVLFILKPSTIRLLIDR
ncbi:hypothetical protein KR200_002055, partial [Drosophila serrata]